MFLNVLQPEPWLDLKVMLVGLGMRDGGSWCSAVSTDSTLHQGSLWLKPKRSTAHRHAHTNQA